jgi:hypothetical protein
MNVAPGEIDEMSRYAKSSRVPLCNRQHPDRRPGVRCTRAAGHDETPSSHRSSVQHVATRPPFYVTVEVWL